MASTTFRHHRFNLNLRSVLVPRRRHNGHDIVSRCPTNKEAYIWYDKCSLRYSDSNFFGYDAPPDLIALDYSQCIQTAASKLPTFAKGARLLLPSCNVSKKVKVLVGIIVPVTVLALLLTAGLCVFLTRRVKKKTDRAITNNVESVSTVKNQQAQGF
ncbi:hypothetical protein V2J09_019328 [Rumex salicifolius]